MQVRIQRTTVPCSHVKTTALWASLMSLHKANLLFDLLIAPGSLICTARMWKAESRLQHDILAGVADESASQPEDFYLVHCASIKHGNVLLFHDVLQYLTLPAYVILEVFSPCCNVQCSRKPSLLCIEESFCETIEYLIEWFSF